MRTEREENAKMNARTREDDPSVRRVKETNGLTNTGRAMREREKVTREEHVGLAGNGRERARFRATPLYASSIFALRERTNDVAR